MHRKRQKPRSGESSKVVAPDSGEMPENDAKLNSKSNEQLPDYESSVGIWSNENRPDCLSSANRLSVYA